MRRWWRLIGFVIVWGIVVVRFVTYKSRVLPKNWRAGDKIRVVGVVKEPLYQKGTEYVLELGRIKAYFQTYKDVKVGECGELVGRVRERVQGGKVVAVYLKNPSFRPVLANEKCRKSWGDKLVIGIVRVREKVVAVLEKVLPEPEASLAVGILLGVKRSMGEEFYEDLIKTGTVHVVAASGFNVSVVARVVMGVVVGWVGRGLGVILGVMAIGVYVIMAGGSAAVVRAGIMGGLAYVAYYWGRVVEAKRLLGVTVWLMVMVNPLMVVDVGFQLSVAATVGILYLGERLVVWGRRWGIKKDGRLEKYLADVLYPTLAASITTLPIIWWWFGRVSLISPLVNMLILGVVPMVMGLTGVVGGVGLVWLAGAKILSWPLYVLLDYMVQIIKVFGRYV